MVKIYNIKDKAQETSDMFMVMTATSGPFRRQEGNDKNACRSEVCFKEKIVCGLHGVPVESKTFVERCLVRTVRTVG